MAAQATAEAQAAHQKEKHEKKKRQILKLTAKLKQMKKISTHFAAKAARRKAAAQALAAKAKHGKHALKKALKSYAKVGDIRSAGKDGGQGHQERSQARR